MEEFQWIKNSKGKIPNMPSNIQTLRGLNQNQIKALFEFYEHGDEFKHDNKAANLNKFADLLGFAHFA
ncbi:unnamed protein product [Brachionus calyciflorus]|uniref:Uncharacterized protein n=1 Tax=Brachionus calyciflorus TaxID=104777 RepID=A0A813ZBN3_9BILA|nr:unnamed protein product [Brachionus calyciflorus]